jgi:type II secretory pathway pseudopilin PulG
MSQAKLGGPRVKSNASRGGFTLVEVLIATVVTLLMMLSLAQVFKLIGDSMKQGRAALELNSRLRNVAYRIQLDLNNCTVTPKPGSEALQGSGYSQIYDGPLTDYSYGMAVGSSSITPLERLGTGQSASRFGDVDDIIMFTARAGDDWYVGKVPLFVLQKTAPTATNLDLVTITAQHAEIAIFAEPLVTNELNPNRNPAYLVLDPANNFSKLTDPSTGTETNLPSSFRLHYRTLLIRPDLNNLSGVLPSGTVGSFTWLTAQNIGGLPARVCDMAIAHQQCDLSIRRVDQASGSSTVAANSLEDLANPSNRFAHVELPMVGANRSMPVLALSPKLDMRYCEAEPGILLTDDNSPSAAARLSPANYQSGFLHPAYMLRSDPVNLRDDRTGEDILASDVLAFDVKGYDPSVTLYQVTDTNSQVTVYSPNDPGYGLALLPPNGFTSVAVGAGDFVDIGWGRKSQMHFGAFGTGQLSGVEATAGTPFTDSLYKSGLAFQSGFVGSTNTLTYHPYTTSATHNFPTYSANLQLFQPSYDTWYSRYEGDGVLQSELNGSRGLQQFDAGASGPLRSPEQSWRGSGPYVIDAGTDGIDNTGSGTGVDDLSELETSPPFPADLRGVKITIRMEDTSARTFNQMTVTKEFVTQ